MREGFCCKNAIILLISLPKDINTIVARGLRRPGIIEQSTQSNGAIFVQDQTEKRDRDRQAKESDIERFINGLSDEERMLIVLLKELYDESWDAMLADLRNRLDGKPYIFKLATRIRSEVDRIEKLRDFEKEYQVKLTDYVKPPG